MANLNFNKIILGGRLTAAPELKQTQSGIPVCSFSIAVNRRAKAGEEQKADFFNVTAWRQTAEFVSKYFSKGSSILDRSERTEALRDRCGRGRGIIRRQPRRERRTRCRQHSRWVLRSRGIHGAHSRAGSLI